MSGFSIAVQLSEILARENAALARMDLHEAAGLLDTKTRLAAALAALPPAAIKEAEMRHLQSLADENRQLLQRAMLVQQRVIALVRNAVLAAQGGTRYGAAGRPTPRGLGPCAMSRRV